MSKVTAGDVTVVDQPERGRVEVRVDRELAGFVAYRRRPHCPSRDAWPSTSLPVSDTQAHESPMRRRYRGTSIDVSFDATRCRHAAECLRGLPSVFDVNRRPWILPGGGRAEDAPYCDGSGTCSNWSHPRRD